LNSDTVRSKKVIIEVYGLGYVGLPLSVRLSSAGFHVIGIDKDSTRVERLCVGKLHSSEEFLKNDFEVAKNLNKLFIQEFTTKSEKQKVGIICVPTPVPENNIKSDKFVKEAAESFLNNAKKNDVMVLESSIEVGTTDKIKQLIESHGFKIGENFGLAFCPERIDPKNKKWNLENIPRIIYCSDDQTFNLCKEVYTYVNNANLKRVSSSKVAEVVKSFENTFRLVNISLVNELAILCDKLGINVNEVIDAASTKPFGFMPFYPGAGAGGHCIPKDPRFLLESAKKFNMKFQTLENAINVNQIMPKYIADSIENTISENHLKNSVLVCGLSYKPDIEDFRDSAGFKIIQELKKKNMHVMGYDPYYKEELKEKYSLENHLSIPVNVLKNLDDDSINEFDCLCIVQHHSKVKFDIEKIYINSKIKFIYDCQNQLVSHPSSKTILKKLGQ
jgi:UDP-N-acetyl-D-glucosamine dehydrogenase